LGCATPQKINVRADEKELEALLLKRLHLLVMSSAVGNRASAADEIGGGSSARI